jgi:hypothetical protein
MDRLLVATVPKWDKFNPRSDRANYTWFRMQNDFFHDQRVFRLTDSLRCLYLFVLCECSRRGGSTTEIASGYAAALLGRPADEICNDFQRLIDCGLLTSESRHEAVIEPSRLPATYVRTNVTDDTNVTNERESAREEADDSCRDPAILRPMRSGIPDAVRQEWEATAAYYKRTPNWVRDEPPIIRAHQKVKDWGRVRLAIAGFRFESKDKNYDPAANVYLRRLEDPKKFDRLEAMGEAGLAGNIATEADKNPYSFFEKPEHKAWLKDNAQ